MEQRAAIKFCSKCGKSATVTFSMMQKAYGKDCLSRSEVFEWYERFRNGCESLEDDPSEGRPPMDKQTHTERELQEASTKREAVRCMNHEYIRETQIFIKQEPADNESISDKIDNHQLPEIAEANINQVGIKEEVVDEDVVGEVSCDVHIKDEAYEDISGEEESEEQSKLQLNTNNSQVGIKEVVDEDVVGEVSCDVHIKEEPYEDISGEEESEEQSKLQLNINNSQDVVIFAEPAAYNDSRAEQRDDENLVLEQPICRCSTTRDELQDKVGIKEEVVDEDVVGEVSCDVHIKDEAYEDISGEEESEEQSKLQLNTNNSQIGINVDEDVVGEVSCDVHIKEPYEDISGEEESEEKSRRQLNINYSQSDVPSNTDNRTYEDSNESLLGITEAEADMKTVEQANMGDFSCLFCGKHFKYQSSFKKHQSLHSGIKRYECVHCNKTFSQKVHLKHHIGIHTGIRPYECQLCDKKFIAKAHLKMHLFIHENKKPFQCDICEKRFAQKGNLEQHKLIHSGIKPFQCTDCNKCFTQKSALNQHKKLHLGYKPWECTKCNKRFSVKFDLKNHELIHSGIKPFQCSVCDRRFRTMYNLNSHKRGHSEDEHFQCIECGKKFVYNQSLTRHLAKHAVE